MIQREVRNLKWSFNNDQPIYSQLIEQITRSIVSGDYKAGEKLASVRDLAQDAGVNPNTMQKALSELERTGLVYSQRTSGRFVTEDHAMLSNTRISQASDQIRLFLSKMQELGFDKEETIKMLKTQAN